MTTTNPLRKTTLSYEVFPPKTQVGEDNLFQVLQDLKDLEADSISVTYSTKNNNVADTTTKIAEHVQNNLCIPAIAHLPAIYLTKQDVSNIVTRLDESGINKILALRGDRLPDMDPVNDFTYASDLVTYIKKIAPHFEITGACYPEIHPEAASGVDDIKNLKKKVDAGCDELITQLFFDNDIFLDFQEKCRIAGIDVPIIPGIMPITNQRQAMRLVSMNETKLPRKFKAILNKYEHNPEALREAGLAYAIDQIVDLVTQDVPGIHLYIMNRSETAKYIHNATKWLFRE